MRYQQLVSDLVRITPDNFAEVLRTGDNTLNASLMCSRMSFRSIFKALTPCF